MPSGSRDEGCKNSWLWKPWIGLILVITVGAASETYAQQGAPPSADAQEKSSNSQGGKEATKINVITGLGHADGSTYQPLTGKQRWQLYLNQTFTSPSPYIGVLWSSVVDQMGNQPPEWKQGAAG